MYIQPYGSYDYGSGGPRSGNFRYEVLVVSGVDDNGHELEFYGIVERLNFTDTEGEVIAPVAADPAHDTENLRYAADYEVEVADGVWWVPAVSLGESRYTNSDIAKMVNTRPGQKREKLATLYEALQLFQIGNFANGNDNQRISERGVNWEHHKPGYHAVRTNEGCCATDSNWLNYILWQDYDEVGFLAYSQSDGGGHILNYIKHEGFYYFIDLTHYRTDFLDSSAPETGNLADYRKSDFVAGNVHKAASPAAYVDYCRASFNDPPELFFMYQAEDCLPVDGVPGKDGICITYANTVKVSVVYDDPDDSLTYAFVKGPQKTYDWARQADAKFKVDEKYLQADGSAAPAADPLADFFQVGDVITLEEYGQQARFADINSQEYSLAGMKQELKFSFEEDIALEGGCHYGYWDHSLNTHGQHAQICEEVDGLRMGEIMIDLLYEGENICVARCVRQGDQLLVTKVFQDDHYYEPYYVRKDENGVWQQGEDLWFIIHYEVNGEKRTEYGHYQCRPY